MRFRDTLVLGGLIVASAAFASSCIATELTIKVVSPTYLNGTVVFPVVGDEVNTLSRSFRGEGPQFDVGCSLYKGVDSDGRINTQITLDMSAFNLGDGRTSMEIAVHASKAGPTRSTQVPGPDGRLSKSAECPSTKLLSFTARGIVRPGETLTLADFGGDGDTPHLSLTAAAR